MRKDIGGGMADKYLARAIEAEEDEKGAVMPSEPSPLETVETAMRPSEAHISEQEMRELLMRLSMLTSSRLSALSEQMEEGFEDVRRRLGDPHSAPDLEHGEDQGNRSKHHIETRTADEDTERAPRWSARAILAASAVAACALATAGLLGTAALMAMGVL